MNKKRQLAEFLTNKIDGAIIGEDEDYYHIILEALVEFEEEHENAVFAVEDEQK